MILLRIWSLYFKWIRFYLFNHNTKVIFFYSYTTFIKKIHLNSRNKFSGELFFRAEYFFLDEIHRDEQFCEFSIYFFLVYFIQFICLIYNRFVKHVQNLISKEWLTLAWHKIMQIYIYIKKKSEFSKVKFCKNFTFDAIYVKYIITDLHVLLCKNDTTYISAWRQNGLIL